MIIKKAPLCKGQTPSQCEGDVATRQKEQGLLDWQNRKVLTEGLSC